MVAQAPAYELGQVGQRALELLGRGRIDVKRGLVADRFGLFLIGIGARVLAARLHVQPLAIPPEAMPQTVEAPLLEVADGLNAERAQLGLGDFADARHAPDGKRRQKFGFAARRHVEQDVRLGLVGSDL